MDSKKHSILGLNILRQSKRAFVLVAVMLCVNTFIAKQAFACCSCCSPLEHAEYHYNTIDEITDVTSEGFDTIVEFVFGDFWDMILPQLRMMTMELSTATLSFPASIGAMLDGQDVQETITRLQRLSTQTAKNQMPAVSMCQFATLSKSLAASEVSRQETTRVLSLQNMKRTSLNKELQGSESPHDDAKSRFEQFKAKYCMDTSDTTDFSGLLEGVCTATTASRKRNSDINFVQLVGLPKTISASLYPGPYGPAESLSQFEDLIALSRNLYGSHTADRLNKEQLSEKLEAETRFKLIKNRSLQAKRNVAQHSFANYVGLKSTTDKADGSELAVKPHIEALLATMGIDNTANNQFTDYFSKAGNGLTESSPSYWTQMEVLTKVIYQDPRFFANLYDNPANVRRQQAAMKAIELMQERDIHETALRSETLLSLWLDSELETFGQGAIEDWTNMEAEQ